MTFRISSKVFGDTTRMRILYSLFESELCVCAIAELLGMTQSAISHQLKVLRENKLVASRREGKTIYYFLRMIMSVPSSGRALST